MLLTFRLLGVDILEVEAHHDSDDDPTSSPRSFGFHASGTGVIERCDDTMLDTLDI